MPSPMAYVILEVFSPTWKIVTEFSQNKPRALHVDKLTCSGLWLLFPTPELCVTFCYLSKGACLEKGGGGLEVDVFSGYFDMFAYISERNPRSQFIISWR